MIKIESTFCMKIRDCLSSLELLRSIVTRVVPLAMYMRNLIIDLIETSNKRLCILPESMQMDKEVFASLFNIPHAGYHEYERDGSPLPFGFLQIVADELSISRDCLFCKCPMLTVPEPRREQAGK